MTLRRITDGYVRRSGDSQTQVGTDRGAEFFAGGTDLIPLTRTGIIDVETFVDIKSSDVESSDLATTVERSDGGWTIGAVTTLADLAEHDGLGEAIPAIREAITQAATLQIRNRATVGGNLLQRPRCSYFRDPDIDACWLKGGTGCAAREGRNEHHALVDAACVATQPSDLASVLVAVDAQVNIAGTDGTGRSVPVAELLQPPTEDRRSLHTLDSGELITSLTVPDTNARCSTYMKAMDRAVWQFALVGVAAVLDIDDSGVVSAASLVASGIDSVPRRLVDAEAALIGVGLSAESIADAAAASSVGLVALSDNGYKIHLLRGLVQRALEHLANSEGTGQV